PVGAYRIRGGHCRDDDRWFQAMVGMAARASLALYRRRHATGQEHGIRSGTGDGVAAGTLAPRCDRHVRRWRIHWLAAAIPVVRTAGSRTCTDQWCDELRIARGDRGKPLRTR